jgi:hypothetical protein
MARSARSKGRKDKKYLAFIRSQPCLLCDDAIERRVFIAGIPYRQVWPTEAAHVGERGLSQKCSDYETLPLCAGHHRIGRQSHHVLGRKFWEHHGINKPEILSGYMKLFKELAW